MDNLGWGVVDGKAGYVTGDIGWGTGACAQGIGDGARMTNKSGGYESEKNGDGGVGVGDRGRLNDGEEEWRAGDRG